MTIQGILRVVAHESRVNGVLLAVCGSADPFAAATNFLAGLGFNDGDCVVVTGSKAKIGNIQVFCLTGASACLAGLAGIAATTVKKAAKKAVKKATKKTVKKAAKKTVKKPRVKKATRASKRRR